MIKLSVTPTKRILVKAFTQSEWDTCNYAIVSLPGRELIGKLMDALRSLPEDGLSGIEYCHSSVEYLNLDEDILDEDTDFSFIDDDVDVYILPKPEQNIDTQMFKMYKYDWIKFNGFGKHTSEEFWTESISLQSIYKNL